MVQECTQLHNAQRYHMYQAAECLHHACTQFNSLCMIFIKALIGLSILVAAPAGVDHGVVLIALH